MIATIFVRPIPGLLYRDPETRELLPAEGREVPRSTLWLRAIRRGDVQVVAPPTPAPVPAPAAAPARPAKAPKGGTSAS